MRLPLPQPVTPMEPGPEGELLGCLFESEGNQSASRTRMYLAASVVIVGAYVAWLSVLESWWPGW